MPDCEISKYNRLIVKFRNDRLNVKSENVSPDCEVRTFIACLWSSNICRLLVSYNLIVKFQTNRQIVKFQRLLPDCDVLKNGVGL